LPVKQSLSNSFLLTKHKEHLLDLGASGKISISQEIYLHPI
jgi:hypothetical protein